MKIGEVGEMRGCRGCKGGAVELVKDRNLLEEK